MLTHRRALALALLLGFGLGLGGASGWPYERWMEDNWEALRDKSLLQLTLPGSHNSGNVRQWLGQGPKCASDDKYAAY